MAAAAQTRLSQGKKSSSLEPDKLEQDKLRQDKLEQDKEDVRWQPVLVLPCQMAVDLPLPHFKVGDFLKLQAGAVIASAWRITRDVPLRVNGTLIGWGEFDGSGKHLAVRLTELA
jgi:flagellar motor switch/type III secretory pathway protein FliN